APEVLRALAEPEPAEVRMLSDRREVDAEAREPLADAGAFEPGRRVFDQARLFSQDVLSPGHAAAGAPVRGPPEMRRQFRRFSEELRVVVWVRRRLEQPTRAPLQVGEVEASLLGALDQTARERHRVVDDRDVGRRLLAHLREDRSLGARGDDRVGDALDPDARAPAAAAL